MVISVGLIVQSHNIIIAAIVTALLTRLSLLLPCLTSFLLSFHPPIPPSFPSILFICPFSCPFILHPVLPKTLHAIHRRFPCCFSPPFIPSHTFQHYKNRYNHNKSRYGGGRGGGGCESIPHHSAAGIQWCRNERRTSESRVQDCMELYGTSAIEAVTKGLPTIYYFVCDQPLCYIYWWITYYNFKFNWQLRNRRYRKLIAFLSAQKDLV